LAGLEPDEVTAEAVIDAGLAGDPLARRILEETGEYLGLGIVGAINVLDPKLVVLGGSTMRAGGETNRLHTADGEPYACDLWADLIHLEGAQSLASYTENYYAGTPAITSHTFGAGAAYYLGTRTEKHYTKSLLQELCDEAAVSPTAEAPPGVDAVRRNGEDASFLFVLNHNQETVEVQLPQGGRDLLTDKEHQSKLTLSMSRYCKR
jgi:beta-galactosidase GanA